VGKKKAKEQKTDNFFLPITKTAAIKMAIAARQLSQQVGQLP